MLNKLQSSAAKQYTTNKSQLLVALFLKLMDLYAKLNMQYCVLQIWTAFCPRCGQICEGPLYLLKCSVLVGFINTITSFVYKYTFGNVFYRHVQQ